MNVMQMGGPALVALSLVAAGCQKTNTNPVESPAEASVGEIAVAEEASSSRNEAAVERVNELEDAEVDLDEEPGSVIPRPKALARHHVSDDEMFDPAPKKSKKVAPGTLPPLFNRNQSGMRAEFKAQLTANTVNLFNAKCKSCHGADGKGNTKRGQKLDIGNMTSTSWQQIFNDNDMRRAILQGFKRIKDGSDQNMPSQKDKLSTEEVRGLVAYVRLFGVK